MEHLKKDFDAPSSKYQPRTKESLKWKYHIEKAKKIEDPLERHKTLKKYVKLQRATPSVKLGAHTRKLMYVRYADDWIVAVNGSYHDAAGILDKIRTFCETHLGLTVSEEKTKITNTYTDKVLFLGTHIRHAKHRLIRRGVGGHPKRVRRGLLLTAPLDRIRKKLREAGFLKGASPQARLN